MIEFGENPIQALPFVFAVCLIYWFVRRAYQKKKHGNEFKEFRKKARLNEVIRLFFVAWAAECVCCTLFPSGFFYRIWIQFFQDVTFFRPMPQWNLRINLFAELDMISRYDDSIRHGAFVSLILMYILNVLMFVPFGFALPFIWKRANLGKVVLVGFLSTLFIEFVQGFMYRDSTIDDIICNTFGALLGYLLYLMIKRLFPKFASKASGELV